MINASSDSLKIREAVDYQEDICRQSWVSYRFTIVDEVRVAREAGNCPDISLFSAFRFGYIEGTEFILDLRIIIRLW